MRIAILGGSFNPPHMCHVFMSCYVLAAFDIDQVWFVPCYKHAFGKKLVPFHHRFTMCCLAVESLRENLVKVSAIEKERHGTSWTIDTVRYLKASYPEHDFTWVIGSDMLDELDKWKDFDQLQELVSFIVVPRAGFLQKPLARSQNSERLDATENTGCMSGERKEPRKFPQKINKIKSLKAQRDQADFLSVQLPNISSTVVRERVKQKKPIIQLVPRKIAEYIFAHKLYEA
jgi:nicotinate-nucleotide adenylyltransferase